MKLWATFRFELAYQARRAWPWLVLATVLVLSFMLARDMSLADAMYEEFHANSPFAVAKSTVLGTLFWLLLAPSIAGDAGARDLATRMHPLVYTTPITKADYLGGRFLAALALNALILLAVQAGIMLGIYWPGVDASVIGPFRPAAFLTAYAIISLPNAVLATTIQFALAQRSGRAMASYAGSVLLIFLAFFLATILNSLVRRGLGTLLDPIGLHFVIDDLAYNWTSIERNTRLLALEGAALRNRLFWLGVALAVAASGYLRFRFEHRAPGGGSRLRAADPGLTSSGRPERASPRPALRSRQSFGLPFHLRQTLAIAAASFRAIATSRVGLIAAIGIPLVTVVVVLDQMSLVGSPLVPTTAIVVRQLIGGLSAELAAEPSRWVIVPLLVIYFAGELVWRERDAGLGEIGDAMPGSEWAPLLGKLLGLALAIVAFTALLIAAGMLAQAIRGYRDFEIGLYVKTLLGLQLVDYLLFAALALVVHVVVHQKYVGHAVAVLAYAFVAVLAGVLGVEHNLLVYGRGPGWSYTPMRGFGASVGPWAWFALYWGAWALLLAVAARLLWVRGEERRWRVRLRAARQRLTTPTRRTAAVAGALVALLGGWIFYNTNVRNAYRSSAAIDERRAEYERRYGRYERAPQPRLTRADVRVEIDPGRRALVLRGSYHLVNRTPSPIDSIHVAMATAGAETRAIAFDRAATLLVDDAEHAHRIYALARPLAPGDSLRLEFAVSVEPRGFRNGGVDRALTARGSYFTNASWFPAMGYQPRRALVGPAERRAHGLAPRPVLASLSDEGAIDATTGDEGTVLDVVLGTAAGQVAVAPGDLRRTWTERGRRYFHYVTSAPIGSEWAFFSAPYAMHEDRWRDVAIRIFHDPRHGAYVDRTLRSVRASLDYYTSQYGPYPYGHLTIVERPGAPGYSLHADASLISHGESFPDWVPGTAPRDVDVPYAVVAHEVAHQWSLPYAPVEGLPFLAEGLATYSAIQVVKESRGEEQGRRFLAFTRQPYPYPTIRRGEPLLRALDPYMARRWGPLAMEALTSYMGVARVNGAIRRLYARRDSAGPGVTTLDLYRELQAVAPDSLRPLLHDFFEINAYWQLRAERATAVETAPGVWRVTLDVRAHKKMYDSTGVETELPMREWVEVGVFGAPPDGHDALSVPLYCQLHRIRSGAQSITVTVRGKPVRAGLDPHHLLDWEEREDDDNVVRVK